MPKRRSHIPAPVAAFVDSEYWDYLDSAAGNGGFVNGFVTHLIGNWDKKISVQEHRALGAAATDIRAVLDREGSREPRRTIGPYHDATRAMPGWLDWPGR